MRWTTGPVAITLLSLAAPALAQGPGLQFRHWPAPPPASLPPIAHAANLPRLDATWLPASLSPVASRGSLGSRRSATASLAVAPTWPWAARGTDLARPSLAWPPDSLRSRPTHWLEGGLIGAALMGLVGTGFCGHFDTRSVGCYVGSFVTAGGFIGFPVGALIGAQFSKP